MVLVAGLSTVIDRPDTTETVAITVDPVQAPATSTSSTTDATATGTDATDVQPDGTVTADPSQVVSSDAPATTPNGGTGQAPTTGSTGSASTGGTAPPSTAPPSTTPPAATPTYPEAPLYDDTEKVRGVTDDEITMCGHAALALGAAFDTSAEDLNVYWDMVNDTGGIHGRRMTMTWEDDKYVGSEAQRAAEACAAKDPFMILGGIGFDQIPTVRTWAEGARELYIHHIAIEPEQTHNYVFSVQPTVELIGREFGNYLKRTYADKKIGIIFRDTPNWNPGAFAGMEVLDAAGIAHEDYAVFQNQGVYSAALNDMQVKGIDVVWAWENALLAAQIINQADEQDFHPQWVVFPFQQTIDLLNDPLAQPIDGVSSWSSYAPGGYGGDFPEFGYEDEIARFEAAYAKYRPDTTTNDILWQVWIGNRFLHRMFLDCGADCNRNRFAGMMLSGYRVQEKPNCEVNFGDPRSFGNHYGNFSFYSLRMFAPDSGPAFRTTRYCAASFA